MEPDVVVKIPWRGKVSVRRIHDTVPQWPNWAVMISRLWDGTEKPLFFTRYARRDYVIGEGLDIATNSFAPRRTFRVALHVLDREPRDAEWPWTWHTCDEDLDGSDDPATLTDRVRSARSRLPELVERCARFDPNRGTP